MGYKLEKDRLAIELKESRDQAVSSAAVDVPPGCKWKAQAEVDRSISMLKHKGGHGKSAGRPGWVRLGRTSQVLVENLKEGEEDHVHRGSDTGGAGALPLSGRVPGQTSWAR